MQFQIQILNVTTTTPAGKKYQVAEVAYKNLNKGAVEGKKILSFVNPDVFNTVSTASDGAQFTVTTEKDDKGYWQWTAISQGGSVPQASAPATKGNASPKSTYETPEERAQKQVYIVRQSSITNAIAFITATKKTASVEDVLAVAKQFERFVFDVSLPDATSGSSSVADIEDDIPY